MGEFGWIQPKRVSDNLLIRPSHRIARIKPQQQLQVIIAKRKASNRNCENRIKPVTEETLC
jgi:hypothetical protein